MNLALTLLYAAERTPEAEALVEGDVRVTYRELRDRAARLAAGLAARGIEPGDRVALVARNRLESAELLWACAWLGAVLVPLSHRIARTDLDYCVADSGAKLLVEADEDVSPLRARAGHPGALDLDEREPAIMLYTSGTTGRPKGVPRSHRADRAAGLSQVLQHGYRPGDRTLGVMPLYHTMGVHSLVAMALAGGCYVCQRDWDAAGALELVERERLTSLYLAPTLFHDLVESPALAERDRSSVEVIGYAGSSMTGALAERCASVFAPRRFFNHYGSTEIYTFSLHPDQAAKPGCAGRAALNARLRLLRPDPEAGADDEAGPGEDGQVACHLSSDEAFAGYWKRPDADAKALRAGWYLTGDLARLDADGELWLVGRVDDMIISGGENIHPLEIEEVLVRAPGVREVAVVGAPDDRWGQRVVAYVVAEPGVTAAALDAFCLASPGLARFKRPREYRFAETLPKSPSGKLLRRLLREGETA
ncbi:MAG: AMP-binding protein [Thermoleophilia bacterium]|nr:AMP-binding protein [Thermoleophilia bacterium]